MSNHFHLVAVADQADAVSLFRMDLNGLYATHRNVTHRHTGRVGQGPFYSAVLDPAHVATALNPVRARMVARAGARSSGLGAHAGVARHARVCAKLAQPQRLAPEFGDPIWGD